MLTCDHCEPEGSLWHQHFCPRGKPPALWTTWRDERDGRLVTIVRVQWWDSRIALMPPGGHGSLTVEVDPPPRRHPFGMRALSQTDFEAHFTKVYDPHMGWDVADGEGVHAAA